MEGVSHSRTYRTRNTGTSSQFDYTTTGTRASLSCYAGVYTRLIGSVSGRDMLMEECKERLFTAKSRDYQRPQEGKERGERSWWWGDHHAHSPDAVRFLYSNLVFLVLYYTDDSRPHPPDRTRPTSSRNNYRSWRRCRPSRNSASASSKSGRFRGQAAQPASQKYQLCQKYPLDLWSRVPHNPLSVRGEYYYQLLSSLLPLLWIPCARNPYHPFIHHPFHALLSLLATPSLGPLFIIIVAPFPCLMISLLSHTFLSFF